MGELSKKHATEMFRQGDEAHLQAGENMKGLMQNPAAMQAWFESKRKEIESLPED